MNTQSDSLTKESIGFVKKADLRKKYGISKSTFCKYLKRLGIPNSQRKFFTQEEIKNIYDKLGKP